MTDTPETPDTSSGLRDKQLVDPTRRKLAVAGGSAVLATLASRPVLGCTCLTPSAAGSGNHSQHHPPSCTGGSPPQWWINNVKQDQAGTKYWSNTTFMPNTAFHPTFTAGTHLNMSDSTGTSYTFWEVLTGMKGGIAIAPNNLNLAQWFVAGLLSASKNQYGGVIQDLGPDPSVRGIEDEFARNGYFQATAGKQWGAATIIAYLEDPGSVF